LRERDEAVRPFVAYCAQPKTGIGYDYDDSEISFNMEGRVNGGTVAALVERLTLHDQPVGKLNYLNT
jgi:hypothetical protein